MKVSKELREELGDYFLALLDGIEAERLIKFRDWCNETQIDKAAGPDYKLAWQLVYSIPVDVRRKWFRKAYDSGCNDDHISTVLRRWVKNNYQRLIEEKSK